MKAETDATELLAKPSELSKAVEAEALSTRMKSRATTEPTIARPDRFSIFKRRPLWSAAMKLLKCLESLGSNSA